MWSIEQLSQCVGQLALSLRWFYTNQPPSFPSISFYLSHCFDGPWLPGLTFSPLYFVTWLQGKKKKRQRLGLSVRTLQDECNPRPPPSANAIPNGMIGTQLEVWKYKFCRFSLFLCVCLRTLSLNDWTASFFFSIVSGPLNQWLWVHFLSSSSIWLVGQVSRSTEGSLKTGKFLSEC